MSNLPGGWTGNKNPMKNSDVIRRVIDSRRKNGWWKNPEHTKRKISEGIRAFIKSNPNTIGFKFGELNCAKRLDVRIKISDALKGRNLGEKNPSKRFDVRKKISEKMLGRRITWKDKISFSEKKRYENLEEREKSSLNAIKCLKEGKIRTMGWYFSRKNNEFMLYRSKWELERFMELEKDDSVLRYEYEKFRVPYFVGNVKKYTLPDLFIHLNNGKYILEEIKPLWVMERDNKTRLKLEACREYSKKINCEFRICTKNLNGKWVFMI
jgi:hypothetical protein